MSRAEQAEFSPAHSLQAQTLDRAALQRLSASGAAWLLEDCELQGDFSQLQLKGFAFKRCVLTDSSWASASLEDSLWQHCRAGLSNFSRAQLTDSRFEGCDLNNSHWRNAKLASTTFKECKLTGANFEGVAGFGLVFEDSLLIGAALSGMSFRKMHLKQLDFSEADLSACDFRQAVFEGGSLRNAHIKQTQFGGADLRSVELGGLNVLDTKAFAKAVISQAQAATILEAFGLQVH